MPRRAAHLPDTAAFAHQNPCSVAGSQWEQPGQGRPAVAPHCTSYVRRGAGAASGQYRSATPHAEMTWVPDRHFVRRPDAARLLGSGPGSLAGTVFDAPFQKRFSEIRQRANDPARFEPARKIIPETTVYEALRPPAAHEGTGQGTRTAENEPE